MNWCFYICLVEKDLIEFTFTYVAPTWRSLRKAGVNWYLTNLPALGSTSFLSPCSRSKTKKNELHLCIDNIQTHNNYQKVGHCSKRGWDKGTTFKLEPHLCTLAKCVLHWYDCKCTISTLQCTSHYKSHILTHENMQFKYIDTQALPAKIWHCKKLDFPFWCISPKILLFWIVL